MSNSRRLLQSIPESERAPKVKGLDLELLPVERALGIQWNTETDHLEFDIKYKDHPVTRRGILSVVSSTYDSFGFVSPYILPAKILQQDLCRLQLGCDDEIPKEYLSKWENWMKQLPKLKEFKLNRCIKPHHFGKNAKYQLHHFCDAAQHGYGAVSYIRLINEASEVYCTIVSRPKPKKQLLMALFVTSYQHPKMDSL